jgi:hypothetical protein
MLTAMLTCHAGKNSLAKFLAVVAIFLIFQFKLLGSRLNFKALESDSPYFNTQNPVRRNVDSSCGLIVPVNLPVNNHMEWVQDPFKSLFRRRDARTICDEESLLRAAVKYYVYPQNLLFSNPRYYMDNLISNELGTDPRILPFRHRYDARYENDILWSLQNHSLRVDKQEDAELVVIPVPFGTIYYDIKLSRIQKSAFFQGIWANLKVQPAFVSGKPHVLISMTNPIFSFVHIKNVMYEGLDVFYNHVQSVSVARGDDHFATRYVYLHNVSSSKDFRGYDELFSQQRPVTKFTFCVGLGGQAKNIPLVVPTWEKFQNSTYFIFYHTRTTTSDCNSTFFRHAPGTNVSMSALPL